MKKIGRLKLRLKSKFKNWFYYDHFPRLIDSFTKFTTRKARQILKGQEVLLILIDTQIFFHSITHLTCKISTGKKMWGDTEIDTFTTARVPVQYQQRELDSVQYLPSIVSLANQNFVQLCSSWELRDEQWSQPTSRFRPLGLADYSLMQNVDVKVFDDKGYKFDFGSWIGGLKKTPKQQRQERLSEKDDLLYLGLLSVLGQRNSQDIWHIVTAEREGCYCLLTMDYRLIKTLESQKNNEFVKSLKTKVMTPEQLGKKWNLRPVHHRFFSYHEASTPVRTDLRTKRG